MAQTALEASKALTKAFRDNYDPEIFGVQESCTPVNDASRNLVYAMVADSPTGEVWLGNINRYDPDERLMSPYRGPVQLHIDTALARDAESHSDYFVRWVGIVYNFGASFVVPCFDEALHMALIAWNRRGATPTEASANWDLIADRVNALGGHFLHWS